MQKQILAALLVMFGLGIASNALGDNVSFPIPPRLTDTSSASNLPELTDNVPFPIPPRWGFGIQQCSMLRSNAVYRSNRRGIRQVALLSATALVFGAGLVLAATSGRSELSTRPTVLERQPLWMPGGEVPMSTYLRPERAALSVPPRWGCLSRVGILRKIRGVREHTAVSFYPATCR
jgi:hypothetical protein